ncbi:MAG: hypothetical protein R2794_01085 [Chitinophagales bacterium]
MKAFIQHTFLFLLPLFIGAVILCVVPIDRKDAYLYVENTCFNRGSYVYDRIFRNETPIDIACLGTSHTMNAVMDSAIEADLHTAGVDVHFCNLAYCWEGLDAQYVFLQDLIQNKQPDIVLLEVREHEHNLSHEIFPYIANAHDLVVQPYLTKWECIPNLYTGMLTRWSIIRNDNNVRHRDISFSAEHGFVPNPGQADSMMLDDQDKLLYKNYTPLTGRLVNYQMHAYSLYYYEKIVALCAEHHIDLIFVYVPAYGHLPVEPLDAERYRRDGDLWLMPDSIRFETNYWVNHSHMNVDGASAFSSWLSGQLFMHEKKN